MRRPGGRWWAHPDALLAAAVVAVYAPALAGPFQWDDHAVIVGNRRVHSLSAWAAAVPTGVRPVLHLTYALNWALDPAPLGFRAVNVTVHALNTVLVRRLVVSVAPPGAALAAAALFGLHPVQTEAVTYVSGRSSSLMACAYLVGLLLWRHGRRRGAFGAFVLALGSKEAAFTWPAAVVLVDVARGRPLGATLRALAPAAALALVALGLVVANPRYRELIAYGLALRGPLENLPSQVAAIGYLLSRLLVPWRLSIDPALPVPAGWTPGLAMGGLALVGVTGAAIASLRRRPAAAFAACWLVLQLLPTNSVVARADVANERQLYLAALGPFLLLGLALAAAAARRPLASVAVAAMLVTALATLTVRRNRDYRSGVALWSAAARLGPGNARAFNNLGYEWQRAGCAAEARAAYDEALRLRPDYAKARSNIAALDAAGDIGPCREAR